MHTTIPEVIKECQALNEQIKQITAESVTAACILPTVEEVKADVKYRKEQA